MPAPHRELVLATRNRDKILEMQATLAPLRLAVRILDDFPGMPEVLEDGDTLEHNAGKKALAVHHHTGLPALADDTGLFVAALQGAPGVHSNRYAGSNAGYQENVARLLHEMRAVPPGARQAEFHTVIAFAQHDRLHFIHGVCPGTIALAPRGQGTFGYDPVFVVAGTDRTFAEMSLPEKNAVSHRGRALAAFKEFLTRLWSDGVKE